MLSISKKDAPIIIIYSNPNTILSKIKNTFTNKKKIKKIFISFVTLFHGGKNSKKKGKVKFYPWRSFSSDHQKILFPDNFFLEKSYLKFYFTWRINLKIFL